MRTHAADRRERPADRPDDVGHADLGGRPGEPKAPVAAALRLDELGVLVDEDVLQEGVGIAWASAICSRFERPSVGDRELERGAEGVVLFRGDPQPPHSDVSGDGPTDREAADAGVVHAKAVEHLEREPRERERGRERRMSRRVERLGARTPPGDN